MLLHPHGYGWQCVSNLFFASVCSHRKQRTPHQSLSTPLHCDEMLLLSHWLVRSNAANVRSLPFNIHIRIPSWAHTMWQYNRRRFALTFTFSIVSSMRHFGCCWPASRKCNALVYMFQWRSKNPLNTINWVYVCWPIASKYAFSRYSVIVSFQCIRVVCQTTWHFSTKKWQRAKRAQYVSNFAVMSFNRSTRTLTHRECSEIQRHRWNNCVNHH